MLQDLSDNHVSVLKSHRDLRYKLHDVLTEQLMVLANEKAAELSTNMTSMARP